MMERVIGKNDPSGRVTISVAVVCVLNASKPGGISSSKTTSPPAVVWAVPSAYRPPKFTRKSEVATPSHARVACRIWLSTEGKLSFGEYCVGPELEAKNVMVLLGSAARSNFSGTGK